MFQADDNLRVKNRDKELEEVKRIVPTANLKELTCAQFAFTVHKTKTSAWLRINCITKPKTAQSFVSFTQTKPKTFTSNARFDQATCSFCFHKNPSNSEKQLQQKRRTV